MSIKKNALTLSRRKERFFDTLVLNKFNYMNMTENVYNQRKGSANTVSNVQTLANPMFVERDLSVLIF